MINIEIQQIANGYLIKLFSSTGNSELDKTVYVGEWKSVYAYIDEWLKQEGAKA
jgi:hypothetical protein